MVGLAVGLGDSAQARADGTLFFGGWYGNAIGRMSFDGGDLRPDLIRDDLAIPTAMVVHGNYLYWQTNSTPLYIARARLDGSHVRPRFIRSKPGEVDAEGLSVYGGRLYWTETVRRGRGFRTVIDRARLDGRHQQDNLLTFAPLFQGPVVVTDGYVFFVKSGETGFGAIERASLRSGKRRRLLGHRYYVPGSLMAYGSWLYWLELEGTDAFLARMRVSGRQFDPRFRTIPGGVCDVTDAEISGGYLFVGCDDGSIERRDLNAGMELRVLQTHGDLSDSGPVLAAAP